MREDHLVPTPESSWCGTLGPEGENTDETISEQVDEEIPKEEPVDHTPETCIICIKKRKNSSEQALFALEKSSIAFFKEYALEFHDDDLLARLNQKESAKEIATHHRLCMVSIRNQVKLMEADKQPKTQWH